ncbi:uncharacterized protein LOC142229767 [Haematobia irritans]|uniref:UMA domain-containing protein n=1 Tax=Haematobia irritans TaxID=7368 RepID=A0A1L8EI70_HAEIR
MFSFFTKKSQNSDSPVIQGPSSSTDQQGADDFIFVEKKGQPNDPPQHPHRPVYPSMPAAPYGTPYPRYQYPGPPGVAPNTANSTNSLHPVPYVQDIPFVLAPQLCTKTTFDNTQMQVDGILAFLTRQMSVDAQEEYNFTLEQNVLQDECY